MCGIMGGIGPGIGRFDDRTLEAALATIRHRGPDAGRTVRLPGAVLGHRRLSIIDLDPRSDQPMRRGDLSLVFNGEIYNYQELRRDLESRGLQFQTTSDTEVLLAAFEREGLDCLSRLEGMFAFAVINHTTRTLTLARDRFGEKPLFFLKQTQAVLFASEIRPLWTLADGALEEDETALSLYFRFSYIPAPLAAFKGMQQVEPGSAVTIDFDDLTPRVTRYFDLAGVVQTTRHKANDYEEAVRDLRERLTASVEARLAAADVPVGTLLSGGIDSAIVTALAHKVYGRPIRAYSLSFPDDPDFDEGRYAHIVAATLPGLQHAVIPARVGDILDYTDTVFDRLSEPLADASLLPTAYLCHHIDEKVVLGGDGADELFGGYGVYPAMTWSARLPSWAKRLALLAPPHGNPARIRHPVLRAAALLHANMAKDPLGEYLNWRSYAAQADLRTLGLDPESAAVAAHLESSRSGRLRDIQIVDIAFNLPNDMLKKVDYASMLHSIEVRLPYLDSGLAAWALALPDRFRIQGRVRKRILRDAFRDMLPEEILTRRKMGFLLPIRAWFKGGPLRDSLEALAAGSTRFDPALVRDLLARHASGREDRSVLLWALLAYLRWRVSLTSPSPGAHAGTAAGPAAA